MTRRQGGWGPSNSHLVTFRLGATYGRGDERLEILPGARLVGTLYDGAEPALMLPAMTLALSREMVEIAPNPDPTLTLQALAQQTEREAGDALAAGDICGAAARFLEAAVQYRLLNDLKMADGMQLAARKAHNRFLRTEAGRADFDRHTADLSDEALRQLGATVRAALRQLGGYQYEPATFAEALAVWDVMRQAMVQVANIDSWNRTHPRTVEPLAPETMWVGPDYLADELLTEPKGSPERLAALAETALALDPDDADAHTTLGSLAAARGDRAAARRWYEQGVRAGERKLGPDYFSGPDRPPFWLAVETRPYMRARSALAHALYKDGELERAIAEFWGMLEFNPGDNQGIRYVLSSLLLELPDHADFERLHRFMAEANVEEEDLEGTNEAPTLNGSLLGDDDEALALDDVSPAEALRDPLDPAVLNPYESAYWLYPVALYHFQRRGDSERARAALEVARKQNRHVPLMLTGQRRLPADDPGYYSPGSLDEAVLYVRLGRAAWTKTPGASEWLRASATPKHGAKAEVPPPTPASRKRASGLDLRDLLGEWVKDDTTYQAAQTKKVYRATLSRLLNWLESQGEPLAPTTLTAGRIGAFLATVDATRRSSARNSIAVWCDWLVRRGTLKQNPVVRGV